MPKFDIIDDRFGEPVSAITPMDIDKHEDRTLLRAASDDQIKELLRGNIL